MTVAAGEEKSSCWRRGMRGLSRVAYLMFILSVCKHANSANNVYRQTAVSRPSIIHHPSSNGLFVNRLCPIPRSGRIRTGKGLASGMVVDRFARHVQSQPALLTVSLAPAIRQSGTYNRRADSGNERVDDGQRDLPWRLEIPAPVQMQPINAAESDWDEWSAAAMQKAHETYS